MQINLMDPENLKKLLGEMDLDCALRVVLSALAGKKRFVEQLSVECTVMSKRGKETSATP